jgi:hypothetical protein
MEALRPSRTILRKIDRSRQVSRGSWLRPQRLGQRPQRASRQRSCDPRIPVQRPERGIRTRPRGISVPRGAAAPGCKRLPGTLRRRRGRPRTTWRPPRSAKSRCRPKMEKSTRSFHPVAPRLLWRQKGSRRRGQNRPGRHKRESPGRSRRARTGLALRGPSHSSRFLRGGLHCNSQRASRSHFRPVRRIAPGAIPQKSVNEK